MIISTENKLVFDGDGETKQFEITFPFIATSDLILNLFDEDTQESEVITQNWSYNQNTNKITYPVEGGAIASNKRLIVIRSTSLTQEKDHNVRTFTSEDVETMADKLTLMVQDALVDGENVRPDTLEIATQAEVNEGIVTSKAVSPKTLKTKIDNDLSEKQDKLTAGTGITISDNVISSTSSGVPWGNITGTLSEQADLKTALDAKQSVSNLVTSISSLSTNTEYPSAKCVYDIISSGGSGSVPTLTWYTNNTGLSITIADTSAAKRVKVYKNGLLLEPTADYSISGTRLTLTISLDYSDKICLEVF